MPLILVVFTSRYNRDGRPRAKGSRLPLSCVTLASRTSSTGSPLLWFHSAISKHAGLWPFVQGHFYLERIWPFNALGMCIHADSSAATLQPAVKMHTGGHAAIDDTNSKQMLCTMLHQQAKQILVSMIRACALQSCSVAGFGLSTNFEERALT